MNSLIVSLTVLILLAVISCGASNMGDEAVTLDGPILETVGREGNIEFNGAVINSANYPVKSVYVVILLKDSDGDVIEANNVLIKTEEQEEVLQPSQSALFSVPFKTSNIESLSREVEIYYDLLN